VTATVEATCDPTGGGWRCRVEVTDGGSTSTHVVGVTTSDLATLDPGAGDPVDLVRRSFDFLLARESKESILRSFDLPLIGRYFPEYQGKIRRR
jgi:hypothetical protein